MKTQTKTELQQLVLERMSPFSPVMSDGEISQWLEDLPETKAEMTNMMGHILFSCNANKLVCRHLQQIAKECTLMLNALYHYPDFEERMLPLFQAVLECLQEILDHLQSNYCSYLDPMVAMPVSLYRAAATKIETQAGVLVQAMTRYHICKTLQALVICKMTGLLKKSSGSWREIDCLEKLQRWIMELCNGRNANLTEDLIRLLIRAGFNTNGFVQFCKLRITEALLECYETKAKYDCLCCYERDYSILNDKHRALKFMPGLPKAKDQLLDFVRAHLSCMGKSVHRRAEKVVSPTGDYRLPVSVTVEVLAYLFKLLVTNRVIQEKEKKVLISFLVKNFRTPQTGEAEISAKSLDTKYRQVTKNTAITVRSMLTSLLKTLDHEFE